MERLNETLQACNDAECRENNLKLEELQRLRLNCTKEERMYLELVREAQVHIKECRRELKEARAAAREDEDFLSDKHQQLLRKKIKLDLGVKDLADEIEWDSKHKKTAEAELNRLRQLISEVERELEVIKPKYEEMKSREQQCSRALAMNKQKRQDLYSSYERNTQSASDDDRGQWLESQLQTLNNQIKDKEDREKNLCEELTREARKVTELQNNTTKITQEIKRKTIDFNENQKLFYENAEQKNALEYSRKEILQKIEPLTVNITSLRQDLAKTEQALSSVLGKPILTGWESIRQVIETYQRRGGEWAAMAGQYCGLVVANVTCNQAMYTAVEVVAGNRLYHHVVESDTVASKFLYEKSRQKLPGEATFITLNRLEVRESLYPKDDNATPLLDKLNYDPKYSMVMNSIFGDTLVCKDLESAVELEKKYSMKCVTLDGYQVSKGLLTGGNYDESLSLIVLHNTYSQLMEQITPVDRELKPLLDSLNTIDFRIAFIVLAKQRIEKEQSAAKLVIESWQSEISLMKEELASIEQRRGPMESSLADFRQSVATMLATEDALDTEFYEFMKEQSLQHEKTMYELIEELRRTLDEKTFSRLTNLEATEHKLEDLLSNLTRRKEEVMEALQEISVDNRKRQLECTKNDLLAAETQIQTVKEKMEVLERKMAAAAEKETALMVKLNKWRDREMAAQTMLEQTKKKLQMTSFKEIDLHKQVQECLDKTT